MGAQRLSHVFDFERRDELIKERRDTPCASSSCCTSENERAATFTLQRPMRSVRFVLRKLCSI